jgi:hypothetical protein
MCIFLLIHDDEIVSGYFEVMMGKLLENYNWLGKE